MEATTTMLWIYALKDISGQLNNIRLDNNRVTTMVNFAGTKTDITLKIITHGVVQPTFSMIGLKFKHT